MCLQAGGGNFCFLASFYFFASFYFDVKAIMTAYSYSFFVFSRNKTELVLPSCPGHLGMSELCELCVC